MHVHTQIIQIISIYVYINISFVNGLGYRHVDFGLRISSLRLKVIHMFCSDMGSHIVAHLTETGLPSLYKV